MNIADISTEELQKELERREDTKKGPAPLTVPNWTKLQQTVVDGIQKCIEEKYMDEDFTHYVYEAAMEAVYGDDFWKWRNKQKW